MSINICGDVGEIVGRNESGREKWWAILRSIGEEEKIWRYWPRRINIWGDFSEFVTAAIRCRFRLQETMIPHPTISISIYVAAQFQYLRWYRWWTCTRLPTILQTKGSITVIFAQNSSTKVDLRRTPAVEARTTQDTLPRSGTLPICTSLPILALSLSAQSLPRRGKYAFIQPLLYESNGMRGCAAISPLMETNSELGFCNALCINLHIIDIHRWTSSSCWVCAAILFWR